MCLRDQGTDAQQQEAAVRRDGAGAAFPTLREKAASVLSSTCIKLHLILVSVNSLLSAIMLGGIKVHLLSALTWKKQSHIFVPSLQTTPPPHLRLFPPQSTSLSRRPRSSSTPRPIFQHTLAPLRSRGPSALLTMSRPAPSTKPGTRSTPQSSTTNWRWKCCECGTSKLNQMEPSCYKCQTTRCKDCPVEVIRVRA